MPRIVLCAGKDLGITSSSQHRTLVSYEEVATYFLGLHLAEEMVSSACVYAERFSVFLP